MKKLNLDLHKETFNRLTKEGYFYIGKLLGILFQFIKVSGLWGLFLGMLLWILWRHSK